MALLLLIALSCSATGVAQLRFGGPPKETGVIAGHVVDSVTNEALGGIQVTLTDQSSRARRRVIADSKGRFYFGQLPARQFSVHPEAADVDGPTIASPLKNAVLVGLGEDGRVIDLRVPAVRLGSVTGVVRDDAGDPVVGMQVVAFRSAPGEGAGARVRTDDRGVFRLLVVRGEYLICACELKPHRFDHNAFNALDARPLGLIAATRRARAFGPDALHYDDTQHVYAPTFHPGAHTPETGARVAIGPGEHKSGIDIAVVATRAVRVSGQVVGAFDSVVGSTVFLRPVDDRYPLFPDIPAFVIRPDGHFTFLNVPPGEYVVTLRPEGYTATSVRARSSELYEYLDPATRRGYPLRPSAPGVRLRAEMKITVGDRDLTGLVVPSEVRR